MFRLTSYIEATCALCEKRRMVFVTTCERGTFADKPLCIRCLEKQAALQTKTTQAASVATATN